MILLFFIVISYLIGSIPTAYLAGKIFAGIDIRTVGSGNMGATNVWRGVGKFPAVLTLIIDVLKGFFAVKITQFTAPYNEWFYIISAVFVIIGHSYPVFLRFKGGKGVAASCGVFIALAPKALGAVFLVFVSTAALFHYISLASLISSVLMPFFIWYFDYSSSILFFSIIAAAAVIIRHKTNIKRLLNGTENRFHLKK